MSDEKNLIQGVHSKNNFYEERDMNKLGFQNKIGEFFEEK